MHNGQQLNLLPIFLIVMLVIGGIHHASKMKVDFYNSSRSSTDIVVIYCHGLTQSSRSDFSQRAIALLNLRLKMPVIAFDFDFITEGRDPSPDFRDEIEELNAIYIETIKKYKPLRVLMIGKSIGAVISLGWISVRKDSSVAGIGVLGLPFKLGYPPRIQELSRDGDSTYDYAGEYRKLLSSVNVPIFILQGELDDLGGIADIKKTIAPFNLIELIPIFGAGHNLEPSDEGSVSKSDSMWTDSLIYAVKKMTVIHYGEKEQS